MTQTQHAPTAAGHDDQPLPGATFAQAVGRFYGRYATFSGRASRSEYWWVSLYMSGVLMVASFLLGIALGDETQATGAPTGVSPFATMVLVITGFFIAASLVPALALNARRLHDANLSGWVQLVCLVPSAGSVVMMVLALLPSSGVGARFDRHAVSRPWG